MSRLEELSEMFDGEDETALISLDMEQAIMVTRGAIGTGDWYRDPCSCPEDDCPGKEGGNFKVISLLLEDIEGKEYTILVPAETQLAELLIDPETIDAVRNALRP